MRVTHTECIHAHCKCCKDVCAPFIQMYNRNSVQTQASSEVSGVCVNNHVMMCHSLSKKTSIFSEVPLSWVGLEGGVTNSEHARALWLIFSFFCNKLCFLPLIHKILEYIAHKMYRIAFTSHKSVSTKAVKSSYFWRLLHDQLCTLLHSNDVGATS